MTKEELVEFLKENLRIEMSMDYGMYDESDRVVVQLYLGNECISEASQ